MVYGVDVGECVRNGVYSSASPPAIPFVYLAPHLPRRLAVLVAFLSNACCLLSTHLPRLPHRQKDHACTSPTLPGLLSVRSSYVTGV